MLLNREFSLMLRIFGIYDLTNRLSEATDSLAFCFCGNLSELGSDLSFRVAESADGHRNYYF